MPSLDTMLPEIMRITTDLLDPVDHCMLKLVSKAISALTSPAPTLDKTEWIRFNKLYEAKSKGSRILSLACSRCTQHLDAGLFADSQATKKCATPRICLACGIKTGKYSRRTFLMHGEKCFACAGCRKAKKVDQEDETDDVVRMAVSNGGMTGAHVTIGTRGKRWCKRCWMPIKNYQSAFWY